MFKKLTSFSNVYLCITEKGVKCGPKRVQSLGNILSPSNFRAPIYNKTWLNRDFLFIALGAQCNCDFAILSFIVICMDGRNMFLIKGFWNYDMHHSVYMICCPEYCLSYFGCTIRTFEGLQNISKANLKHLVLSNIL